MFKFERLLLITAAIAASCAGEPPAQAVATGVPTLAADPTETGAAGIAGGGDQVPAGIAAIAGDGVAIGTAGAAVDVLAEISGAIVAVPASA